MSVLKSLRPSAKHSHESALVVPFEMWTYIFQKTPNNFICGRKSNSDDSNMENVSLNIFQNLVIQSLEFIFTGKKKKKNTEKPVSKKEKNKKHAQPEGL